MASAVSVEEVSGAAARRRFVDLPHVLSGTDPRFAPLVLAWERYRLDRHRNPYLAEGEAVAFLARRGGHPVGRIAAHLPGPDGPGAFGFWWTEDDAEVAALLFDAAQEWLGQRGASSMTGPLSFTAEQEAGVLVEGADVPGVTGRPWHPPHLARLLEQEGFEPTARHPSWRLPADPAPVPVAIPPRPRALTAPGPAGPYADRRLRLDAIEAVPDVSEELRRPGFGGARRAARRARSGRWDTAVVVGQPPDPATTVPALVEAAGRAGYRWVIAPWSPTDAPPETVHATFTRPL